MQDVPDGCEIVLVQQSRVGQGGSCLKCMYVHRGSFKSTPLAVLAVKMNEHDSLRTKLFG